MKSDIELVAIDINKPMDEPIVSEGTAYYRLDEHMKEFLQKCQSKHGIIGFTWDNEDPLNFGVILDKEAK